MLTSSDRVPGVGKTSTAECIAEYTSRPLFPITCGDIGETASTVETNLARHFQLAHKWGCVLLLDEADVFMAKRVLGSANDIQRNSLVSGGLSLFAEIERHTTDDAQFSFAF